MWATLVPLIGLGLALAYRYREKPWVAGLGLAVAAAPKSSGILLAVPFVITLRWRHLVWMGVMLSGLAAVPVLFFRRTWQRYFEVGLDSIQGVSKRVDNLALLRSGLKAGLSRPESLAIIAALAIIVALWSRDTFWPIVWLLVAALPISWMYSLLTLLPLFARSLVRKDRFSRWTAGGAAFLTVATPPLGIFGVWTTPFIMGLGLVALWFNTETGFWPTRILTLLRLKRLAAPRRPSKRRMARFYERCMARVRTITPW